MPVADDFPAVEVLTVEHGFPIGAEHSGRHGCKEKQRIHQRGFHSPSIGFGKNRDHLGYARTSAWPGGLCTRFAGSDLILHAGGDARRSADSRYAAATNRSGDGHAGNIDRADWARALPETAVAENIYMLHNIHDLDLDPAAAGFRAVVTGHSHKPGIFEKDGVLYINPGSAGPRRFRLPVTVARLDSGAAVWRAEFVECPVPRQPAGRRRSG